MKYFNDVDLKGLWSKKETEAFVFPRPSDKEISASEKRLGVKLPASYIELMSASQNGGLLKRNASPVRDIGGNIIRHVKNSFIQPISLKHDRHALKFFYDTPNLIEFGRYLDIHASFGSFVLNYLKCSREGEPSVAYIDRKVRYGRAGEPVDKNNDWRIINEMFYWELTTIAPTFEAYIKELVIAPKLPAFDFAALKAPLKQAAQKSFREIIKVYGRRILLLLVYILITKAQWWQMRQTQKDIWKVL